MKRKKQFLEIARFGLGGVVGVSLFYITLYVLTEYIHVWYLASSIAAYAVNQLANFIMQKFWTFKNKNKAIRKQLGLYFAIAGVYFLTNTGMMYICVEYFRMHYILSQMILTVLISIMSYFSTKKIFAH